MKTQSMLKSILSVATIAVLLQMIPCYGANSSELAGRMVYFTDSRDGKKYGTVKIGFRTWLTENLDYNANGSKCNGNEPANCQKYGRLYDWETAMNACPKGCHLPTNAEWQALVDFFGGEEIAGKKLKARSSWEESGNGTDEFGFAALPGGFGDSDGNFYDVGINGFWWGASESDAHNAHGRFMGYYGESANWGKFNKSYLFSVRCLKD